MIRNILLVSLACLLLSCGNDSNSCYSPTSNLSSAYGSGAVGCACDPAVDKAVCADNGASARPVALVCGSGHWQAVMDGPCMPGPDAGRPGDSSVADSPVADSPAADSPAADSPTADSPAADSPATDSPAADRSAACYSPTSDLSSVYQTGAVGCACDPAVDKDVCVHGVPSLGSLAVMCIYGHWAAGLDGPCMPGPEPGPDGGRPVDGGVLDARLSSIDGPVTCSADSDCPYGSVCEPGATCSGPKTCVGGCHVGSQCGTGNCQKVECFTCPCPGRCQ